MAKEEGVFFVGIKDPVELRRNVLETAKEAIQTLQLFEKFRNIRDEKVKTISQFKSDLREITRLVSKLRSSMPKAKLRIKLHEHERLAGEGSGVKRRGKKGRKKSEEIGVEGPARGELEKLEEELSAIEGKLGSLG